MITVNEKFRDKSVCIMGLGYVGLTLATVMADVGFDVTGVEIRDDVLEKLNKGEPHFFEPSLPDHLRRLIRAGKIKFFNKVPASCNSTVYIITVGTPLGPDGKSRLDVIENVAIEVAKHLKDGDMVILRSTVKLKVTRKVVMPLLEKAGVRFDLAFCPERTIEGHALIELRQLPQIVGGINSESAVRAAQLFQFVTPSVVRVSDVETAEMIKLIDNAHRDVFLAYGNEVARMCDAAGISAAEVISRGKLGYPRTNVAWPGPVGGPCLEKDPHILAEGLRELGIESEITLAARRVNERQPSEVIGKLAELTRKIQGFSRNPVISLLGIAFKGRPATDDLRGTMARPIFIELQKHFSTAHFRGYDPMVSRDEILKFGLDPQNDLSDAFSDASIVLILNNHPQFAGMPIEKLAEKMAKPAVVYDFWNNFISEDLYLPAGVKYVGLGSIWKSGLLDK
ncbi:nucleotide sugar dehydrogenase [Candidatus Peregrinibacteria bacterium]|nr:nucleotide sugar dehydrogenase [Candidatus Peregrinibacteria bacterium]